MTRTRRGRWQINNLLIRKGRNPLQSPLHPNNSTGIAPTVIAAFESGATQRRRQCSVLADRVKIKHPDAPSTRIRCTGWG
jgi:hypothetical protein